MRLDHGAPDAAPRPIITTCIDAPLQSCGAKPAAASLVRDAAAIFIARGRRRSASTAGNYSVVCEHVLYFVGLEVLRA